MPDNSGSTAIPSSEIYAWSGQLAAESRESRWLDEFYVAPSGFSLVARRVRRMRGGIIALVGFQGVGKTSALQALCRHAKKSFGEENVLFFRWRRRKELFRTLSNGDHEAANEFREHFRETLFSAIPELKFKLGEKDAPGGDWSFWVEKNMEKPLAEKLREHVWLSMLLKRRLILVDMADYSQTDRRAMATDLNDIYWLWNTLATSNKKPNLVVAVQKEMLGGHFFFDKMDKIELERLRPEEMLTAYKRRFKSLYPFEEDALITLARMSRGVFRRFLRYITRAVEAWDAESKVRRRLIDQEAVKKAITIDQLVQDMDMELSELYPKQSDLKRYAVQLLLHLEEHGPQKQSQLAMELGLEEYTLTRLIQRLELHGHLTRESVGKEKIVRLKSGPRPAENRV